LFARENTSSAFSKNNPHINQTDWPDLRFSLIYLIKIAVVSSLESQFAQCQFSETVGSEVNGLIKDREINMFWVILFDNAYNDVFFARLVEGKNSTKPLKFHSCKS